MAPVRADFTPGYVDATARITVAAQAGGFAITKSHLVCMDQATFAQHAEAATAGCPVSRALAGTDISLEATLVE